MKVYLAGLMPREVSLGTIAKLPGETDNLWEMLVLIKNCRNKPQHPDFKYNDTID